MADFTALRRTDAAGFTGSKRRHVVVKHEAFTLFAGQTVNNLFVLLCTERSDNKRLGFTAGKERRTMSARKNSGTNFNRTYSAGITAVNTRFTVKDLTADVLSFHLKEDVVDFVFSDFAKLAGLNSRINLRVNIFIYRTQAFVSILLASVFKRFMNAVADDFGNEGDEFRISRSRLPIPQRFAAFFHQFVNRVDNDLHLLVTKHNGAEHDFFRELIRFGFHHQNGSFSTRDNQVQLGVLHLRKIRAENILIIDITDARGRDRSVEGDAGNSERCRSRNHGRNIRINFRIYGKNMNNDLYFVKEAFRKERTNRTVDQTGSQSFFFARTAFTFKEAAGDFSRSIGFFNVIDCQREEILSRFDFFFCNYGCKHHGVIHVAENCACGLTSDFTGFKANLMVAVLKRFNYFVKHRHDDFSFFTPRHIAVSTTRRLSRLTYIQQRARGKQ